MRVGGSRIAALVGALALPALAAEPTVTLDLATVSTSNGVLRRVHGSTGNGAFGVPVAGGHDVDGDGLVDHAFSSMVASPLGRFRAGIVYVVLGDGTVSGTIDTAFPNADVLQLFGDTTSEAAGSELWIDDVTGDGLGDVLIARQNHRPDPGRPGAGALSILVGGAAIATQAATLVPVDLRTPPPALSITTIVGAAAVDRLGMWMRTGDVTGDGIADIVVGADQEDGPGEADRGALYVVRGGAHLASTQTIDLASFGGTTLAGDLAKVTPPAGAAEYHFGATCQVADLDGNDRAEVMAAAALNRAGGGILADGAPGGSAHGSGGAMDGTLYVLWDDNFLGDPWPTGLTIDLDAPPGSRTVINGGALNVSFGEEILGGLDYDDDGAADLFVGDIVGNLTGSLPSAGSGHVFYDAASLKGLLFDLDTPPPGLMTSTFLGGGAGHIAGDTAMHGDFDADGVDDLAFSSPHAAPQGRPSAGAVHVFFGQDFGPWPALIDLAPGALPDPLLVRITEVQGANGTVGGDVGDTLCYSGAAGDVDGDGYDDLITNEMLGNGVAPIAEDVGNLLIVSGRLMSGPPSLCATEPIVGCRQPGVAKVKLITGATPSRNRLTWRWKRGDATALGDFGAPLSTTTTFGLCLYDASAESQPRLDTGVAGGAGWKATGTSGFSYANASGVPFGVHRMKLRAGAAGTPRVLVKGRRERLELPVLPLTYPVTVQLLVDDGGGIECWEATFATPTRNDAVRTIAKIP